MDTEARGRCNRFKLSGIALCVAALAACAGTPPPQGNPAKEKVKVVVINPDGTADPDPVKLKKNVDIVVWVAEGGNLHIEFVGENPFSKDIPCEGSFCGLLLPPSGAEKSYPYRATITKGGTTRTADPQLEVVK